MKKYFIHIVAFLLVTLTCWPLIGLATTFNVPGGGGGVDLQEEGSSLGEITSLNFAGGPSLASINGSDGTVTISGVDMVNVRDFGAAGVKTTTTTNGSHNCGDDVITLTDASSFSVGHGIAIPTGGKDNTMDQISEITAINSNDVTILPKLTCNPGGYYGAYVRTQVDYGSLADGSSGDLDDPAGAGTSGEFSVKAKFRRTESGLNHFVTGKDSTISGQGGYMVLVNSSDALYCVYRDASNNVTQKRWNTNPTNSVWYVVECAIDVDGSSGERIRIRIDGDEKPTGAGSDDSTYGSENASSLNSNNRDFRVGTRHNTANDLPFNGSIDEVAIFNYARSEAESASDWSSGCTGSETGIIACYKHEQNFNDSSSNGLNLSNTGVTFTSYGVSGAVSSGTTVYHNDTAAIQEALATGKNVYCQKGDYPVYTHSTFTKLFNLDISGRIFFGDMYGGSHTGGASAFDGGCLIFARGSGNSESIFHVSAHFTGVWRIGIQSWLDAKTQGDAVRVGNSGACSGSNRYTGFIVEDIYLAGTWNGSAWTTPHWNGVNMLSGHRGSLWNIFVQGWENEAINYDIAGPCGDLHAGLLELGGGGAGGTGSGVGIRMRQADYNKWMSVKVTNAKQCFRLDATSASIDNQYFINPGCENPTGTGTTYPVFVGGTHGVNFVSFTGGGSQRLSQADYSVYLSSTTTSVSFSDYTIADGDEGGIFSDGTDNKISITCKNMGNTTGSACVDIGPNAVDNMVTNGIIKDMDASGGIGIRCQSGASASIMGNRGRNNVTDLSNPGTCDTANNIFN